jgi:Targeting protein for Xklp2 (TPX2) domain
MKPRRLEITVPISPPISKPKRKATAAPDDEISVVIKKPVVRTSNTGTLAILPGSLLHQKAQQKIEARLQDEQKAEKLKRTFQAHPAPTTLYKMGILPPIPEKPLTEPAPFALHTEEFHKRLSALHCKRKLHHAASGSESYLIGSLVEVDDNSVSDTGFVFKARPVPKHAPFVPQRSTKPLTQQQDLRFLTDERRQSRAQFELHLKKKGEELEAMKARKEQLKENIALQEVRALRKQISFKANPIRYYADVHPKQQDTRSITVPKSPNFLVDKRALREKKDP